MKRIVWSLVLCLSAAPALACDYGVEAFNVGYGRNAFVVRNNFGHRNAVVLRNRSRFSHGRQAVVVQNRSIDPDDERSVSG